MENNNVKTGHYVLEEVNCELDPDNVRLMLPPACVDMCNDMMAWAKKNGIKGTFSEIAHMLLENKIEGLPYGTNET